jgi:hypothetical protein
MAGLCLRRVMVEAVGGRHSAAAEGTLGVDKTIEPEMANFASEPSMLLRATSHQCPDADAGESHED